MLKFKLLTLLGAMLICSSAYAIDTSTKDQEAMDKPLAAEEGFGDKKAKYQKIVDDYKKYLTTVKKEVRDEIVGFRKEIARLNGEKRKVYKSLSQEAQHYLAKERELKKKLPKDERDALLQDKDEE
jgi:hypothetical protein